MLSLTVPSRMLDCDDQTSAAIGARRRRAAGSIALRQRRGAIGFAPAVIRRKARLARRLSRRRFRHATRTRMRTGFGGGGSSSGWRFNAERRPPRGRLIRNRLGAARWTYRRGVSAASRARSAARIASSGTIAPLSSCRRPGASSRACRSDAQAARIARFSPGVRRGSSITSSGCAKREWSGAVGRRTCSFWSSETRLKLISKLHPIRAKAALPRRCAHRRRLHGRRQKCMTPPFGIKNGEAPGLASRRGGSTNAPRRRGGAVPTKRSLVGPETREALGPPGRRRPAASPRGGTLPVAAGCSMDRQRRET